MGILDKAKQVTRKTADATVAVGKKGVDATKHAIRKKTCPECKYYAPIDDNSGDCPIGGRRLATADIATCPQKAFMPNEDDGQYATGQYGDPQHQQYAQPQYTQPPQQYPPAQTPPQNPPQ